MSSEQVYGIPIILLVALATWRLVVYALRSPKGSSERRSYWALAGLLTALEVSCLVYWVGH